MHRPVVIHRQIRKFFSTVVGLHLAAFCGNSVGPEGCPFPGAGGALRPFGCIGSSKTNRAPLPSPSLCAVSVPPNSRAVRAAVQPEAVPAFARGEAVLENPRQILRGNAHPVVNHRDPHRAPAVLFHLDGDALLRWVPFVHRVFGVVQNIDEDLQDLVFIYHDRRRLAVFADHLDGMAAHRPLVHVQRVIHQIGQMHRFHHAGRAGVALLRRHDLLDVFDVGRQGLQLANIASRSPARCVASSDK